MNVLSEVRLWGRTIGAVAFTGESEIADFEYHPDFLHSDIQVAPIMMPLFPRIYRFSNLSLNTFHGLPGMLADALPDKFGNALIDAWLATQGRTPESFNAIERLCYIGSRGMGALEFAPALGPKTGKSSPLHLDQLVGLASEILEHRNNLSVSFGDQSREAALREILQVGTSAGGARAKAIIAWNPQTHAVRSGQVKAGPGFEYWLLKFDGVAKNRDKELADPQGYGAIEYAYAKMAAAAGVTMSECRLLEENGRRHFMTRRFDRLPGGEKLHMQSLGALAHLDFNLAGTHSYEQAFLTIRQLDLPMEAIEQQFRRMVFNIVARNQDDHVKNISFLMDKSGQWSLAPAFDVVYSYQPSGEWTSTHQMSMNNKRDHFLLEDFKACARTAGMKRGRAESIIGEVQKVVRLWHTYAEEAGVAPDQQSKIQRALRLDPFP